MYFANILKKPEKRFCFPKTLCGDSFRIYSKLQTDNFVTSNIHPEALDPTKTFHNL